MEFLGGGQDSPQDLKAQSHIEAMVIMICADGEIHDQEIDELSDRASSHPLLSLYGDQSIDQMIERAVTLIETEGFGRRLELIAERLPEDHERAEVIRSMAWICTADGELSPEEVKILDRARDLFGISMEEFERLLDHS